MIPRQNHAEQRQRGPAHWAHGRRARRLFRRPSLCLGQVVAAWLALFPFAAGFAATSPPGADTPTTATTVVRGNRLDELSGIVPASRPGEYWAHNDHGNKPALYRFNNQGEILQRVVLQDVKNTDWEAIARDATGRLLVGDVGDNKEDRKKYRIHLLKEPPPGVEKLDDFRTVSFRYPKKKSHNCEAMFLLGGSLHLVTKESDDKAPSVYRLDLNVGGGKQTAEKIGTLDLTGQVTDAAYSRKRRLLVVLTYHALYFFRVTREPDLWKPPIHVTRVDFGQCEAACFDGDDLVIANESGRVWKYPVEFYLARDGARKQ